jgi:hypothetical protein
MGRTAATERSEPPVIFTIGAGGERQDRSEQQSTEADKPREWLLTLSAPSLLRHSAC